MDGRSIVLEIERCSSGGSIPPSQPNIHDLAPPPTFPRSDGSVYASPCLCAPVTPLNSAASERESLQGAEERGPLSRIWAMTASSSAPTTLVSLCPEPSISEIPPYHCQDMPAYPPPSIKFLPLSPRKWFHLKGCVLDGLCKGSTLIVILTPPLH